MSGKCICKPGIKGDKCDLCPDGSQIEPHGCEGCKCRRRNNCKYLLFMIKHLSILQTLKCISLTVRFPTGFRLQRCGNETCQFGEVCQPKTSVHGSSYFTCSCEGICNPNNNLPSPVCGNNGKTYKSECDLLKYSCEQKKHVLISSYKSCNGKNQFICSLSLKCIPRFQITRET